MGSASSEPYKKVEHQSAISRLFSSILLAICVAPLLILGMCVLLGWNEQRSVCSQMAVSVGKNIVQQVSCEDAMAGSGSLVVFSCDIATENLHQLKLLNAGDFSQLSHPGVGIKVESYMYQCIEEEHKHEQKANGGDTNTIYTYTYSRKWTTDGVDSKGFGTQSSQAHDSFNRACGGKQNPSWDPRAPKSVTKFAQHIKVGAFTSTMIDKVPLDTPVQFAAPQGWRRDDSGWFHLSHTGQPSSPQVGDMKVMLKSNDPNALKATLLGQNDAGKVIEWKAPSSWLCSGVPLSHLQMGAISKDDIFNQLAGEEIASTWVLRFIGFAFMWVAFCLLFGPLEVAGDFVPCIGRYIGEDIAAVTCCVACLPATACTLGVAGVVWMTMRPIVGVPFVTVFVLILGGLGSFVRRKKQEKDRREVATQAFRNYGTVEAPAPQPPSREMRVQAPLVGKSVHFLTADGIEVRASVPPSVQPGEFFDVAF